MRKFIKLVLLLIWLYLIFGFSNQSGDTSQGLSDGLLGNLYALYLRIGNMKYDEFLLFYGYYFRKLAHIFEYFILGILVYTNLIEYLESKVVFYSILFCIVYAISDEIHQLFIIDRSFGFIDIIIDSFGSILGIIISFLYRKKCIKE